MNRDKINNLWLEYFCGVNVGTMKGTNVETPRCTNVGTLYRTINETCRIVYDISNCSNHQSSY